MPVDAVGPDGSSKFPRFRPRLPWLGGDLQTLRDMIVPDDDLCLGENAQTLEFQMQDSTGDRLTGVLEHPRGPTDRPLAVLIHGLTGCADSRYLRRTAGRLLDAGYPALRLNLRGAGPSRAFCREQYHSGRSEDLDDVLAQLPSSATCNGLVLVGWSLGANMLLKGLAEFGSRHPVLAGVAVSAPIDLAAAAIRLGHVRNRVYHDWLLARMKAEARAAPEPPDAATLAAVRGIIDFDDAITAPRNGFAGAADYYRRCSAAAFMPAIEVPTLVIHALDDPWIPSDAYRRFDWEANPRLTPLLADRGGHVGFHARGGGVWSDDCLLDYLGRTLRSGVSRP